MIMLFTIIFMSAVRSLIAMWEIGWFVILQVMVNRETKKSRGFGFVTFASEAALNNALEKNGAVCLFL